jgi:hypothetical protein
MRAWGEFVAEDVIIDIDDIPEGPIEVPIPAPNPPRPRATDPVPPPFRPSDSYDI